MTYTNFEQFGELLKNKWCEIPGTRQDRVYSSELLKWTDNQLLEYWEDCRRQFGGIRTWYHELYKDSFKEKEVADIGPGIGLDGIYFAQNGAKITFIDIVTDNLELLERICSLKRIKADYYYIDDFFDYHFKKKFDVFMFIGSMHNAPFEFSQRQAKAMTPFLRKGGKIVMLAYPKERFDSSGAKDFAEFGKMTDGERTPWCEWYNDEKVIDLFGNNFILNWSRNFGKDDIEFNWFDLTKIRDEMSTSLKNPLKGNSVKESKFFHVGGWENFRGEYLFKKGDLEESLKSFSKAVETNPNIINAYKKLGALHWQLGEFEKSINYFEKADKLEPDNRNATCIKVLTSLEKITGTKKFYCVVETQNTSINIPIVHVKDLHKKLGFRIPISYPKSSLIKPLTQWKMEIDDSPIFRYIYYNFRPRRHLEFGTWQGTGTVYCLEECDATVWTINLPFGEDKPYGNAAYGHDQSELLSIRAWASKIGLRERNSYRTDTLGFIGRFYLEKNLGHRVCQIYCDSRKWDISNYPPHFFDTVLIDGAHTKDAVTNDTKKAFQLLRPGGIVMWHDFCPPLRNQHETLTGVIEAISQTWKCIQKNAREVFWIYPSYILLGIKSRNATDNNLGYTQESFEKQITVELI